MPRFRQRRARILRVVDYDTQNFAFRHLLKQSDRLQNKRCDVINHPIASSSPSLDRSVPLHLSISLHQDELLDRPLQGDAEEYPAKESNAFALPAVSVSAAALSPGMLLSDRLHREHRRESAEADNECLLRRPHDVYGGGLVLCLRYGHPHPQRPLDVFAVGATSPVQHDVGTYGQCVHRLVARSHHVDQFDVFRLPWFEER